MLMNLRDLAYEHLIVELGEHFTNGLDYIQTARNSDENLMSIRTRLKYALIPIYRHIKCML